MEDWTEENLVKLSVKELKSLARKSNVNPNFKKAELVKALLFNVKDVIDQTKTSEAQTSRRMTRSRGSFWQATNGTLRYEKESEAEMKEDNLNLVITNYVNEKRIKKKQERTLENIDTYDTAEMFPLVSSIQLATKPLLEITNKGIARSEQINQNELRTAATYKRTKQNHVKNKSTDGILLNSNSELEKVTSVTQTTSAEGSSEPKVCDLNSTFVIEEKRINVENLNSGSKNQKQVKNECNSDKQTLHSSIHSDEEPVVEKDNSNRMKGNQDNVKCISVTVYKNEPGKSKRGKKGKSESPPEYESTTIENNESSDFSNTGSNKQEKSPVNLKSDKASKIRKRKHSPVSEIFEQTLQCSPQILGKPNRKRDKKCNEMAQVVVNTTIHRQLEVVEKLHKPSDPQTVQMKTMSNLDSKHDNIKKRKRRNSPPNTNVIVESKFAEIDQNKSKKRKSVQPNEISIVSTLEPIIKDNKPKRGRKNKQELSLENKNCQSTESDESSLNNSLDSQKSSRQRTSFENYEDEKDSVNRGRVNKHKKVSENKADDKSTSSFGGETGGKSLEGPIRSSTFILSNLGESGKKSVEGPTRSSTFILYASGAGESGGKSVEGPTRSSTFILSDPVVTGTAGVMPVSVPTRASLAAQRVLSDVSSPQRRSLRFSPGPALENKSFNQNAAKPVKSIGSRIIQSSMMKQSDEKLMKKEPGSTLKKTLIKNTPGSIIKKRAASKMPDFKKIHQQLFNNMESLSENKKRQLDRAQGLIQSPIVPRCAMLSPKLTNAPNPQRSPFRKVNIMKVKTPVAPSPLAKKLKTPVALQTPPVQKSVTVTSSTNRFGFRKPIRKEEATNIIGKKLPSMNMEKKKEKDRNLIHGVRMNKRFMLQMQMRQTLRGKEK